MVPLAWSDSRRSFPDGVYSSVQLPRGWSRADASLRDASASVQVVLAVRQQNVDLLSSTLAAVSDPQSPRYGRYLSSDELFALVSPRSADVAVVDAFLSRHNAVVTQRTPSSDLIVATLPVADAERAFDVAFEPLVHENAPGVVTHRAVSAWSIPARVAQATDFVRGASAGELCGPRALPTFLSHGSSTNKRQSNAVGPKDLRARYNVTGFGALSKNNSMAVAEFQGQFYTPSDLSSFFKQFEPSYSPTVRHVYGYNDPSDPGIEASLDVQYILGLAPKVPADFYSNESFDFFGGLSAWAAEIQSQSNSALVHSVSYGDQSYFSQPTQAYKHRMDIEFQKLGVRGRTIIFASGDSGTGCTTCLFLEPSFPATSPHVTSVGATKFISGTSGPEAAVEAFHSGGGFSWDFPTPSYQQAEVTAYFKNAPYLPFSFSYNRKGRGTPDIAALGIGFQVVVNGATELVGGTSASAPTVAGIVALLNDIQLAKGHPPLGFLNPWLYKTVAAHPDVVFDVTEGDNSDGCCFTGFPCAKGWDPDTGVGTPSMKDMLKHLP